MDAIYPSVSSQNHEHYHSSNHPNTYPNQFTSELPSPFTSPSVHSPNTNAAYHSPLHNRAISTVSIVDTLNHNWSHDRTYQQSPYIDGTEDLLYTTPAYDKAGFAHIKSSPDHNQSVDAFRAHHWNTPSTPNNNGLDHGSPFNAMSEHHASPYYDYSPSLAHLVGDSPSSFQRGHRYSSSDESVGGYGYRTGQWHTSGTASRLEAFALIVLHRA